MGDHGIFAIGRDEADRPALVGSRAPTRRPSSTPGGLAMFSTSGTTGRPKGVRKRVSDDRPARSA